MKKTPLVAAVVLGFATPAAYAFTAELAAYLTSTMESHVCGLTDVPVVNGQYAPTAKLHRVELYLRCEVTDPLERFPGVLLPPGGSCCDHLTQSDAASLGVCPDNMAGGLAKTAARQVFNC